MRDTLFFLIPGELQSGTGGYLYDRRMIAELSALGWRIELRALDGSFPRPHGAALAHAARVLAEIPDGSRVLIDGLAASPMPQVLREHAKRLRLLALMHMPLAADAEPDAATGTGTDTDTGAATAQRAQVQQTEIQALRCMRRIIVTGPGTLEWLRDLEDIGARCVLIEPGTDPAPATSADTRERAGALQLLCVATLQSGKGHALLLEALGDLADLPWQLTCVGSLTRSPQTVARVRAQLQHSGLAARVRLAGELEPQGVRDHYRRADLFVLATRFESYGMAVAEAIAHGLPVIGTRTGAIAQLVGTRAGIVVPCGERAALSAALGELLRSPERRRECARGATMNARRLPRWHEQAAALADLLLKDC